MIIKRGGAVYADWRNDTEIQKRKEHDAGGNGKAAGPRLLDISVDTLLSFRGELTDEEIRQIMSEADGGSLNLRICGGILWKD